MAKDEKEFEIVDEVIKKFCRATSSSINTDKCVIMTFDSANSKNKKLITNRNLPYPIATAIQSERYLDSFQMDKLEELCKWFLYSSKDWDPTKKNRNKISQARASKSILHGGISLWKMDIRARAQKAWIFTTFINRLNRSSALAVSYEDAWIHRWRNNMPSEFMKNCFEAWKDYTNSKTEIGSKTIPEGTNRRIRLKEIYEVMMKRIDGQREVMILTEGQRKLREENVNLPHILKNLKNCHNNKGRDLMWRYILKALPKVHGSVCPFCKETETSEHIFFTCKRLGFIKNIQERVLSSRYQWNQRILNQINNPVLGSFIAILFDFIWYSRNKKNHDKIDMELNWLAVTYKMNIAKRAEWEKTFGLMSKHWRLHHSTTIDKVKNQCISSIKFQIKMFTKTWCKNNNLIQILIPDHLMALFNVHK
ncbi:polyprotein [Tieghemostelium lacteum]|uniref:Polyprotein n=1 Tax=Tieghemostelium lacteum TaxID=361077 RepID=A0A151ZKJ7_TIELA|nr:polyprotein [Tieghemostelium lacteum]|eukprot:KYQ94503.1 polyprotein [Tieghemostelium lacteum]